MNNKENNIKSELLYKSKLDNYKYDSDIYRVQKSYF